MRISVRALVFITLLFFNESESSGHEGGEGEKRTSTGKSGAASKTLIRGSPIRDYQDPGPSHTNANLEQHRQIAGIHISENIQGQGPSHHQNAPRMAPPPQARHASDDLALGAGPSIGRSGKRSSGNDPVRSGVAKSNRRAEIANIKKGLHEMYPDPIPLSEPSQNPTTPSVTNHNDSQRPSSSNAFLHSAWQTLEQQQQRISHDRQYQTRLNQQKQQPRPIYLDPLYQAWLNQQQQQQRPLFLDPQYRAWLNQQQQQQQHREQLYLDPLYQAWLNQQQQLQRPLFLDPLYQAWLNQQQQQQPNQPFPPHGGNPGPNDEGTEKGGS